MSKFQQSVTRIGRVRSERIAPTPEGTGISGEALDATVKNMSVVFAHILKDFMDIDRIIPADIEIKLVVTAKGHVYKA